MTVPKIKRMPQENARRAEQAHFIWITLIGWIAANKNKKISYGELAEMLGYPAQAGRTLAEPLGIVSTYCLYNGLPPMSCIVVEQKSQLPSFIGMIPSSSTLEAEQKKVWNEKWHLFRTPSVSTLRKTQQHLEMSDYT